MEHQDSGTWGQSKWSSHYDNQQEPDRVGLKSQNAASIAESKDQKFQIILPVNALGRCWMIQSQGKTNADPSSLGSGHKRKLRTIRWPSWVNLSLRLAARGLMGYSISRFHHLLNFFGVNLRTLIRKGFLQWERTLVRQEDDESPSLLMNSNFCFGVRQTRE